MRDWRAVLAVELTIDKTASENESIPTVHL